MSNSREFQDHPATVRVGLIDGLSTLHRLRCFDPAAPDLELLSSSQDAAGGATEARSLLNTGRLSYVAFFRESSPISPPDRELMREFEVGVPGDKRFDVAAAPEVMDTPPGFYAYPTSGSSLYSEVYFFTAGINYMEDKQPLGQLLVDGGHVDAADLSKGLTEQARDREIPLGQILIEQHKVDPKDIELAVEQQRYNRIDGRPKRLGEIIVEAGLATEQDIDDAVIEQRTRKGKRLGEVLVDMGIVNEAVVAQTLARKFHLPYVDLDAVEVDPVSSAEVPHGLMERYRVLPYQADEFSITIAISDPLAMEALDMLRFSSTKQINEVIAGPAQLEKYLKLELAEEEGVDSDEVDSMLQDLEDSSEEDGAEAAAPGEVEEGTGAMGRLVNRIILTAYREGASDIHVEPNGPRAPMLIRFRVDGRCETYKEMPAAYRAQLVARIKIMASLDITERRKPQDGKIRLRLGDKAIELRVATIPTSTRDEDVVLRILAAGEPIPFEGLGLNERNFSEMNRLVRRPYGLVLVVGPTGSGKTTSLHSALGSINDNERKIWTAEDPVEITQAGLRQVQVLPKIGFTFAAAMRSFLRADPDVIMVGEMRDEETASTGVEASLTGHMVFSTLHTNSAPETITRLIDMGLDPFTFSDALLGVLAQRLVRRLCKHCREQYRVPENELAELTHYYGAEALQQRLGDEPLTLWRGKGCDKCKQEGYKGRMGIHELLVNDEDLRLAIQRKAPVGEVREMAIKGGMTTLLQDGIDKAIEGHTGLQQVLATCSK